MRSVWIHGVLAAIGLAMAAWVWSAGDAVDRPAEAVTLLPCSSADLSRVVLTTKKKTVSVSLEDINGDKGGWITVNTPNATTPTISDVDRFAASAKISRVVEKLTPLSAERTLGTVEGAKRGDLGLVESEDSLEVTCAGETRKWTLGNKTYGGRTRYIAAKEGAEVHLLANGLISDLEMAEFRFMQRDLVRFGLTDIDEATVTASGSKKVLHHRNRLDRTKAMWVAADEPTRKNELYGNWLGKVFRLRALDYLPPGQAPGGASKGKTVIPRVVVELAFKGDRSDRLKLVTVAGDKPGEEQFYAKSGATRGWVKVPKSLAAQVAADVAAVLGQEESEAPEIPQGATPTGN